MTPQPPVAFQIGFNRCGTKFISELFSVNGYEARHWGMGFLAEDIFYSQAAGIKPLQQWPNASLFSDLECVHRYDKPFQEAFKEFRFLEQAFPNALFILNTRDPEAWAASRASHHDGQYIRFHAHHRNLPLGEVPFVWLRDWERHIADVESHFAGSNKLIRYDLDRDRPDDLAGRLSKWFAMKRVPGGPGPRARTRRKRQMRDLKDRLVVAAPARVPPQPTDLSFIESVAEHCIGRIVPSEDGHRTRKSAIFAAWDGKDRVTDRKGDPWPLIRVPGDWADRFLAKPRVAKLDRIQGVLNEVLALNRSRPMEIDMQDARGFGSDGQAAPARPLITYNRREGAVNMPLWPLPGYHTIGERHFAVPAPLDDIAFEDKADKVAWRGNLTGRSRPERFPDAPSRRPSQQILRDLELVTPGSAAETALRQELSMLTRFSFVSRYSGAPEFDVGFTLPSHFSKLTESGMLSALCAPTVPLSWHYGFRYIASLSGHDTGSNFFVAANSNAVVLKEEDGWELFYTGAFRAWQHYIPLAPGAVDIQDRLDWARSNPVQCKAMAAESRQVCAKFASEKMRRDILNLVLDAL